MAKRKAMIEGSVPMFDTDDLIREKPTRDQRSFSVTRDWRPRPETMAKFRGDFPRLDLEAELAKFLDWHLSRGKKWVRWEQAFQQWLKNANGDRVYTAIRAKRNATSGFKRTATYNPAAERG